MVARSATTGSSIPSTKPWRSTAGTPTATSRFSSRTATRPFELNRSTPSSSGSASCSATTRTSDVNGSRRLDLADVVVDSSPALRKPAFASTVATAEDAADPGPEPGGRRGTLGAVQHAQDGRGEVVEGPAL